MGTVRTLPVSAASVRLADAVARFLHTIAVANTRRGYAVPLDRMVRDFGADTNVAQLDPDRVAGWFTFAWGGCSAKTFNTRLTALGSACGYWRQQEWLAGDPLVRLRPRPLPPDNSKALTRPQVATVLELDVPLRERVLWTLLYESTARAEEVLLLNVPDLDTANRRAVVTRKGGARDVIVWQTGTARLLPRLLAGRKTGPVVLTDRKARPSVALVDVDPRTSRARLSYRRAAQVFEQHTTDLPGGPYTLHQLRHSGLTHAAEDGASTPMLMALSGHTSVRSLAKYARVSAEALGRWPAERDPAGRRAGAGDDRAGLRGGPAAAPRKVLDPTGPSVAGAEKSTLSCVGAGRGRYSRILRRTCGPLVAERDAQRRELLGDLQRGERPGAVAVWPGVCEGEIEIRSVVLEPAEYAVLSPEREDYLRTQIAHRLGFRAAPVCTCEIDSREAGTMRKLIFGMNVTLDGYIAAPGDDIGWSGGEGPDSSPSDELFQWWYDQMRASDLSLYGRKLWETMSSHWPTGDQQPNATPAEIEFARLWRDMPKVVFSSTIDKVDWNTRLVTGDAVAEIARLKAEDGGPMDIGGATLAGAAMRAGLIDEYALVTVPVLVGGGTPFFTALDSWVNLNLVETRTFPGGVVLTRYETRR